MGPYKLVYFDARGRAELIRMLLCEAGVEFVDERIPVEDWPAKKSSTPFGKLPLLCFGDNTLAQSMVITRYLAGKHNLNVADPMKAAFVDAMMCEINDHLFKLPFLEKDEEKKKIFVARALEGICKVFGKLEEHAKKKEGPFLNGEALCYGDLAILNAILTIRMFDKEFENKFPCLQKLAKEVAQRPNVKKHLETRPDAKF